MDPAPAAAAANNKSLKLVIIGASRGTGKAAVEEALARGHQVVAVARTPAALTLEHPALRKVAADVVAPATLKGQLDGADAVIIALGATMSGLRKDPTMMSRGTAFVFAEMRAAKVRKAVILSSDGTGDSRVHYGAVLKLLVVDGLLRGYYADHGRQEEIVRASQLDWTIARPTRLTNGPAKHAYKRSTDLSPIPSAISRADVAHFLVSAAESDAWLSQAVCLGG